MRFLSDGFDIMSTSALRVVHNCVSQPKCAPPCLGRADPLNPLPLLGIPWTTVVSGTLLNDQKRVREQHVEQIFVDFYSKRRAGTEEGRDT